MSTLPQPKPVPASIVSMPVPSPSKSTSSLSTMTNGTLKTFYQPKLISNATGQLTIQEKTNEAEMHIIFANWIHCKGFPFSRCDKAEPCPSLIQQTCPTMGLMSALFSAPVAGGVQANLRGSKGRPAPK